MAQYTATQRGKKAGQVGVVATVAVPIGNWAAARLVALGVIAATQEGTVGMALGFLVAGAFEWIRNYLKHAFLKSGEDREPGQ